ncbi:MAG TPA: phosphoribosylanthranilate isomerase [Kofleriaceae bacterium]|jgi:phosphoribosylanthranilate isomerase
MQVRVKVCGVTLADDAASVAASGVDFIGLNFWPKSKRYLAPERAPMIAAIARAAGTAKLVGVFVDPTVDEVLAMVGRVDLDIIQLHGDETPDLCAKIAAAVYRPVWKAIAVGSPQSIERLDAWPVDAILLDAPTPTRGGAGATFDHGLARMARERLPAQKIVLAGGLRADTVAEAIATVQPWAVDVASGVEAAPGVKDRAKLAAFVAAARGAS